MNGDLLIVAAGNSRRFDGFPKFLSQLNNGKSNIRNTIDLARDIYNEIYVCLNPENYNAYANQIENANVFPIPSGQGDADAILKSLYYIKEKKDIDDITICWGDAVFINNTPFNQIMEEDVCKMLQTHPIVVACSKDENPYAYFELENDEIIKSHFASEKKIGCGIHDQSLFRCNVNLIIEYLQEYQLHLGYENGKYTKPIGNTDEMKLLFFFTYLFERNKNRAVCKMISENNVFSYNTKDELDRILEILK